MLILLPFSLLFLVSSSLALEHAQQQPLLNSRPTSPIMREGTWRRSVAECPPLARWPSSSGPAGPWDLRPDDFSTTSALGDSISAGWMLGGIRETPDLTAYEYRGSSWAAGGDKGEVTVPNLLSLCRPSLGNGPASNSAKYPCYHPCRQIMRHYNRNLTGFSLGEHPPEICWGTLCPVGPVQWNPAKDRLNAALSGSLATNLMHQARDYLILQIQAMRQIRRVEGWNYLSLQIGSNDLCSLCSTVDVGGPGGPALFELSVREVLELARLEIPRTLVNLVGVFDVSPLHDLTDNGRHPYCEQAIKLNGLQCGCALRDGELGEITRARMRWLQTRYNQRLVRIAQDYAIRNYSTFGVAYQPPMALNLSAVPIEALSPADCFHPSRAAHQRIARGVWNRLTLTQEDKAKAIDWDGDGLWTRCLEEEDRISLGA